MIIFSVCNTCLQPYSLTVQQSDADLVKQISDEHGWTCPCPRKCGGTINLVGNPVIKDMKAGLRDPINLTGRELYQAVNGLGLPDEVPKDEVTISSLLRSNRVESAVLEKSGDKFYLHELRLSDGVTVHLAGGPRGAQVLKITKERHA